MPLPIFHAWNLVFLVYLYGIYISLSSILTNKKNVLDSAAFFVAIFGLGISSYYINRSHDFNLITVSFPCFILIAIYLNKLLETSGKANLFRIKNFLSVSVISFVLVTIFVQMLQPTRLINIVAERTQQVFTNNLNNKFMTNGIEIIKSNTMLNEKIFILFADQTVGWVGGPESILYLETKTSSPILIPSSDELILKSDWNILNESLTNNKIHKVFIDFTGQKKEHPLMKIIHNNYYLDTSIGEWRMYLPLKFESSVDLNK